jgi:hypothetical protein
VSGHDVKVEAYTADEIGAYSLAGAGPDTGSGGDDAEGKEGKDSGKGSFGLGLSADVSLNDIRSNTYAHVDGGVRVQAGLGLTVDALDESTIQAISGGAAINTDQGSSGLGGAWSQNTLSGDTHAYVDGASVSRPGDELYTVVNVSAEKRGDIMAISAGGAGQGKIGVAGSVSINELGGSTEAGISNTTLDRANLDVDATDTRDILAIGGSLAFGGKAGVGGGVAINTSNAATRAWLDDVHLTAANAVDVSASNSNQIEAAGAAIAAGANGLAGGLSKNDIANTAEAHVTQSTIGATLGDVSVSASDDRRPLAGGWWCRDESIGFGLVGISRIHNRST